mgnify:FL=1
MNCTLKVPRKQGHCELCGKKLSGRQTRWCSRQCSNTIRDNHRWTNAKGVLKRKSAYYQCAHCGEFTQTIEVNHIVPCKGQHGVWGCHHHQENLELLCKPCHKKVTDEQRKNGWK